MALAAKWMGWLALSTIGAFVLAFPVAALIVALGEHFPWVAPKNFEETQIRTFYFIAGAFTARWLWCRP